MMHLVPSSLIIIVVKLLIMHTYFLRLNFNMYYCYYFCHRFNVLLLEQFLFYKIGFMHEWILTSLIIIIIIFFLLFVC